MVVDTPAQLAKIKSSWQATFDTLPPDGDTNLLPSGMKLQWQNLPRCNSVIHLSGTAASSSDAIACSLENPPVNPVVGPGRPAAQVQHELRFHQCRVRDDAKNTNTPAVFQTDYLFLQLPGRSIELHRVVNALVIDDAIAPVLSFSTAEYVHIPQEG
eukprot:5208466-Pleurochrysis_carterae.AAC.1